MTAAEKILAGIMQSAEETAGERLTAAETQAAEIAQSAEAQAKQAAEEITAKAEAQVAIIHETGRSGAARIIRDALLQCRRAEIEATFETAKQEICALSDADYFDFLQSVLEATAAQSGALYLNKRDLQRDTAAFAKQLSARGISLCEEPADIDGGFLLKNGEIELNASLTALFREKKSELVDGVNRVLFQ
ncbi:MAG: V-type ATP synthase subunit E [Clostridia bacterium]|nr:V-type ATP synthase subunit E [Clostridia bacterium]